MTIKIHHLVAASNDKGTQLTHIYTETYEQALEEAKIWHKDFPEFPTLEVRTQPQGFQVNRTRLPGIIEETTAQKWCVEELLVEKGMSIRELAKTSGVAYSTIYALCQTPFRPGKAATIEKLAHAFAVPVARMSEPGTVVTDLSAQQYQGKRTPNER